MSIKDTIAKLMELEGKATKGPWNDNGERGITQTKHITRDVWTVPRTIEDVTFIAETRNALPQLLDYVEKLEGVVEGAETLCEINNRFVVAYWDGLKEALDKVKEVGK